jgi:hypothetical protein
MGHWGIEIQMEKAKEMSWFNKAKSQSFVQVNYITNKLFT